LPQYQQQANRIFQSIPQTVDFGITHFTDGLNSDVAAVFESSTYFKGVWKYRIDSSRTRKDKYFIPNKSEVFQIKLKLT